MDIPSLTDVTDDFDESSVTDMVRAFYERVRHDDLLGPMYPNQDWEGAEKRLREFLIYRFGGSDQYIKDRGHPRLRMRHAPFEIAAAERDRWLKIMDESIVEAGLGEDVANQLRSFFQHVAEFLRNR